MRDKAFTLAEVLITLGIIGVVAAMTLPAVINKYKEKATVTAVKKNYSMFSQALLMLVNEYGSLGALAEADKSAKSNANVTINALKKYMKIIKACDTSENCMPDAYKTLDGSRSFTWDKFENLQTGILADGTSFWVLNNCAASTNSCFQVGFDINGRKKPNIMGEDFFWFVINNLAKIDLPAYSYSEGCNRSHPNYPYNGYFCSYWIIEHENMNYPNTKTDDD